MPDLLKIYTRSQQLNKIDKTNFETKNFIELKNGVNRHLADDKIFHNWNWFISMNEELLKKIRKSELDFRRDWVLSHIFIELAIDSFLSKNYKNIIDKMYYDLNQCKFSEWQSLFAMCKIDGIDKFITGYSNFLKIKYIYNYKNTDAIIYALNRIYESTGIGKFDKKQNEFILILLKEILPEIKIKTEELSIILK